MLYKIELIVNFHIIGLFLIVLGYKIATNLTTVGIVGILFVLFAFGYICLKIYKSCIKLAQKPQSDITLYDNSCIQNQNIDIKVTNEPS